MRYVSLLLHIYQPPTQSPGVLRRVDEECYTPLLRLLSETGCPVALNINWSLTEQLVREGSEVPGLIRSAGSLELTDSGAYHPILPLLERRDVERQLMLNRERSARHLGDRSPTGVFPPEMAWDPSLAGLLRGMGYRWAVTDDLPWVHSGRPAPFDSIPETDGLLVFLRSNFWSNRIAFHALDGEQTARELADGLSLWSGGGDAYVLLAMDGETFGHHRSGSLERFLQPFLMALEEMEDVELATPGRLAGLFPPLPAVVPAGSWSTTGADLDAGRPWPLWDDRSNPVHVALRELVRQVREWASGCTSERVADLADRMLYSCPFWWAAEGRFDAVQVRRGLLLVLETALAALDETGDRRRMDAVTTAACSIPVITGEDITNAQEG